MQFNSLFLTLAAFAAVAVAAPESTPAPVAFAQAFEIQACGAAGSCNGIPNAELCNDRCKRCSGPTGSYKRGACCGFLNQTCCCYYA